MHCRSPRRMPHKHCCEKIWIMIGCVVFGFILGFVLGYFPFRCPTGGTAEAVAEARAPSTEAETKSSTAKTKSSTAKTKSSTAKTKSSTAEANAPIIEVETESSTTATNTSDAHEAIAREWRNLLRLGCRPRLTSVDVLVLLKAKNDLKDKDFKPKKVTAKCCVDSQSFCETRGHRCFPSVGGVRKKKYAVEFEENGQIHTRWEELWEEVACECSGVGGLREAPCSKLAN